MGVEDAAANPPKMPLWVKVFIGVGVAILVVVIGVLAFGGGEHGPGRHFGAEDESGSGSPHDPSLTDTGTPTTPAASDLVVASRPPFST